MKNKVNLKRILDKRNKAKVVPLTTSLEIKETYKSPVFVNEEVSVNEMDIRSGYDLLAIIKEKTALYKFNELVYIQLGQDMTRKGLYVVKTTSGVEIVTKIYKEETYVSLRVKKNEKNELIYNKYLVEDFLFIFGKVIN